MIAAIDPGSTSSALVLIDDERCCLLVHHARNEDVLELFEPWPQALVIEQLQSYGKPIGRSVLDTAYWIGRFTQHALAHAPVYLMPRMEVRRQINPKAPAKVNDPQVRAYLYQRFGARMRMLRSHSIQAYALGTIFLDLAPICREGFRVMPASACAAAQSLAAR